MCACVLLTLTVHGGVKAAAVGDGSCCFCWDPLVSAAVIPLACAAGHFVHLHCAKDHLKVRIKGIHGQLVLRGSSAFNRPAQNCIHGCSGLGDCASNVSGCSASSTQLLMALSHAPPPNTHHTHTQDVAPVSMPQAGCPGPALTFDYLFCPLCGSGTEGRCGNIQVRHEIKKGGGELDCADGGVDWINPLLIILRLCVGCFECLSDCSQGVVDLTYALCGWLQVMTAQPHLQHQLLDSALQQALQLRCAAAAPQALLAACVWGSSLLTDGL